MTRCRIGLICVLAMVSVIGHAQTATELMQQAIYAQDVRGDLNGAIRLYREVANGTGATPELRAQAAQRLQVALQAAAQPGRVQPMAPPAGLGTLQGRHYTHTKTGITFEIPAGWQYLGTGPSSDDGDMVMLESHSPAAQVSVWVIKDATRRTPDDVWRRLQEAPIGKIGARHAQGYAHYDIARETIQSTSIGGRPAVVATGTYPDQQSGAPMLEYLTWIFTEQSRAFFFSHLRPDDYATLRPQIDDMVNSAVIP